MPETRESAEMAVLSSLKSCKPAIFKFGPPRLTRPIGELGL